MHTKESNWILQHLLKKKVVPPNEQHVTQSRTEQTLERENSREKKAVKEHQDTSIFSKQVRLKLLKMSRKDNLLRYTNTKINK